MKKMILHTTLILSLFILTCCSVTAQGPKVTNNSVFTEDFFTGMISISVFPSEAIVLTDEKADKLVSYLQNLYLEPIETSADTGPVRFGGNQGFTINYEDGQRIHFSALDSTLVIDGGTYRVVDESRNTVDDFGKIVWESFYGGQ